MMLLFCKFLHAKPLFFFLMAFCFHSALMSVKHAKPNFSQSQVVELVKRLYRLTPSEIRPLPSYDDQNFYVAAVEGGEYVLKVMNSKDSMNPVLIEVQTYAMSFLHQNGLPAQTALPTTSGQLMSLEEIGMRHNTVQT